MADNTDSLRFEAERIVAEFLAMYPHGFQRGDLAGELGRLWRVVKHWRGHWQAARRKLARVRRSAVEYKRGQDFDYHEIHVDRAIENKRLRDLIVHAWIHSAYKDCGYDQMTTEQKELYHRVIGRSDLEGGGSHPEISLRERIESYRQLFPDRLVGR